MSASFSSKVCYNPECTNPKPERPRNGWRLFSGGLAELCNRCASTYEEGRFCEIFHSKALGWRNCESCGKRIHCGCIISTNEYVLLDPGGVACLTCATARKNIIVASMKNRSQLAGSGLMPWRQATTSYTSSITHSEMRPQVPNEGNKHEEQQNSCMNISQQSSSLKEDPSTPPFGLTVPCTSANETSAPIGVYRSHSRPSPPSAPIKQLHGNLQSGVDLSSETQTHDGKSRDVQGRHRLLPRYWPRITDQELHQTFGDSNPLITPLFEKMLTASDVGRSGRLVLPKKCAEAYFRPIYQPKGSPLKVQDTKGKEWIFQFRFWLKYNFRVYFLDGVNPFIQSMQLQAGDIVTFSRLAAEGKLVMGFRKASAAPCNQDNETTTTGNGVTTHGDVELADPSSWDKLGAKEALGAKSSFPRKRKNRALVLKSKRLGIESENLIELKLTREEAQGLLRPPPEHSPSVVVIEGFEFEEYENAPVLGKPTISAADNMGSLCSAAQELTSEQLKKLLPSSNSAKCKKLKAAKRGPDNFKVSEASDALAKLTIGDEDDEAIPSSQATTKHPRHRPGCFCIVCIQPPSGKGPKHKQTCTCNVCQTVKRRLCTLMMRREKKKTDKEAEDTHKQQQQQQMAEKLLKDVYIGDPIKIKSSAFPCKGQIDLNMKPEREPSPGSYPGSMKKLLEAATKRYLEQETPSSSICDGGPAQPEGLVTGKNISNGVAPVCSANEVQTATTH